MLGSWAPSSSWFWLNSAKLPSNVSLQLPSARRGGGIAVEWLDSTQTRRLVSRMANRSLAAELER
jgi:hypothetical protein